MYKNVGILGVFIVWLVISTGVSAALIDRGNGMIYDDALDITWLADANYASTQFANTGGAEGDADGRMTWDVAMDWADSLVFGGYEDWRLASADSSDTSCDSSFSPGGSYDLQYHGYNCMGNEMGHLFYIDLGLTADQSILSSTEAELDLFSNIQSYRYWTDTEYVPNSNLAWGFNTFNGYNNPAYNGNEFYAWAVRNGDVSATVPLPSSLMLLIVGLIGFVVAKRLSCNLQSLS